MPALLLEAVLIVSVALTTGALHVAFRDVRYLVESSILLGLYATPILYDLERVPGELQDVIRLNPMTGVLSLSRAAVLGRSVDGRAVVASIVVTMVLLALGTSVFRRRAGEFADLV